MSKKTNGVKYGKSVQKKDRRLRVISMLEDQLKSGKKIEKGGSKIVALSETDIKRINKELETLKLRV